MAPQLIDMPLTRSANQSLGRLRYQGCSGDGARLACLYTTDLGSGAARGTLKVLDADSLTVIWASAGAGGPDLVASQTAGQVPLVLADGRVAAGDASEHRLYGVEGQVLGRLALAGRGVNLGMTPVGADLAIVSQRDGVLTLVDTKAWQVVQTLALEDPTEGGPVMLVSPSSGTAAALYAVAWNPRTGGGALMALQVDAASRRMSLRTSFPLAGAPGASPVVLTPAHTGASSRWVLVHAPGSAGDPQHRLLALADDGTSALAPVWSAPLPQALPVTPAVDADARSLYLVFRDDARVYRHALLSGAVQQVIDLRAETGLPASLAVNGHLAVVPGGEGSMLVVAASVTSGGRYDGQYVLGVAPSRTPMVRWVRAIARVADAHTAAWNLAPAAQAGRACPVVVGTHSGITRLCDH